MYVPSATLATAPTAPSVTASAISTTFPIASSVRSMVVFPASTRPWTTVAGDLDDLADRIGYIFNDVVSNPGHDAHKITGDLDYVADHVTSGLKDVFDHVTGGFNGVADRGAGGLDDFADDKARGFDCGARRFGHDLDAGRTFNFIRRGVRRDGIRGGRRGRSDGFGNRSDGARGGLHRRAGERLMNLPRDHGGFGLLKCRRFKGRRSRIAAGSACRCVAGSGTTALIGLPSAAGSGSSIVTLIGRSTSPPPAARSGSASSGS